VVAGGKKEGGRFYWTDRIVSETISVRKSGKGGEGNGTLWGKKKDGGKLI